jgi:ribosomal protein S18 acetylase RimI-like enzyme
MIVFREVPLPYDVASLVRLIPEFQELRTDDVAERMREGGLLLVAEAAGEIVGFKLGYALSGQGFYSWLGGVVPSCRGQGVARRLLELQEEIVRARGYATITVKSRNRFPAMLKMLIAHQYRIVAVEPPTWPGDEEKIVFEKLLPVGDGK